MGKDIIIGLIGDFNESVPAHRAIPMALRQAGEKTQCVVAFEWLPTEQISSKLRLAAFDGLWSVPASPYRSMAGAVLGIRFARENSIPFLGTCGGFQHAVLEYARNVLGWADAEHAETAPNASRAVIAPLSCSLLEKAGVVRLVHGSRIAAAYGKEETTEEYHCRFGLNPRFRAALVAGPLRATAYDDRKDVRAVELDGHPFFVATLFQPERAALKGEAVPLVDSFLAACRGHGQSSRNHLEH
jgi:CTP synthase (UTP-ammonia lyase)